MKWFNDIKIRMKLLLAFGMLVLIMAAFAGFSVAETYRITKDINELIDSYQTRQIHIADAIADSFRMRVANLSKGYLMLEGDRFGNVVSEYLETFESDAVSFADNISALRETTPTVLSLTESERRQRLTLLDEIEDSYSRYAAIVEELEALGENPDRADIIRIYEEAIPLGKELSDKLQNLRDLIFFTTKTKVEETTAHTSGIINATLYGTLGFVLLAVFALLFTIKSINRPVSDLEKAVVMITEGNTDYPIRSERKDEFGILANLIDNMVGKITEHDKTMAIMDNLDTMICVSDFDYNLLFINKHLADTYNIDREKALKQKCYRSIKGRETPCEFCPLPELLAREDPFPVKTFDSVWDDGLGIWAAGSGSIISWVDGSFVHFMSVHDITRRKQQEEIVERQAVELALQTAKLQGIFDAIPDILFVKDLSGRFVQCNSAMIKAFNRSNEDFVGKNELELGYPAEAVNRIIESEQPVLKEGREVVIEETIPTATGEWTVESAKVPLRQNGSVIGLIGILRNITKHKEMEKEQRELAHWYKSILDATPFPITITDADMKWMFVNKAVEDLIGSKLEDMLGKPCSNWNANICNTPDCGIACVKRGIKRTFFTNEGSSYQVDADMLKNLDGEIAGFIEVVHDITKLKEMEEEALSASKAKSRFLANMSHEIRTPMNAIMGITEMHLQNDDLTESLKEALQRIYNSSHLLLSIINDILDLSKIEAGKLELTSAEYSVASLINDTSTLNMMRIGSKQIEFVLSVDKNTPSALIGDELRIKQILNNLLSNAFKYTEKGTVRLSVSVDAESEKQASESTLLMTVSDTGQGMTKEQVDRLFDEYSRFNLEANRETEGTGLGMSITWNLIRMMNGKISVESEKGSGSTFIVRLPQGDPGAGVLGEELAENLQTFRIGGTKQAEKSQIVFEPMPYGRVLVADDVESNLYVARGLMAPYGLTIDTVMSGFAAIDKIKDGNVYDIVFMDHMMPGMDGIEAVKIIRETGYSWPIFALTANAVVGQSDIFLANGFDGFISKPIDIRQLNSALNKFVRDKQPADVIEAARRAQSAPEHEKVAADRKGPDPQLAEVFVRDASKAISTLEAILGNPGALDGENDLRLYTVNVHAMKSALANIGEAELSSVAAGLEQSARKKDTAVLTAETPDFLSKLRTVAEKHAPAAGESDKGEPGDLGYLREKLLAIKEACEIFDKKTAKDAVTELRQKAWPGQIRDALGELAEHLLSGDFFEVSSVTESLLREGQN
ncbi:MAG: PAS domain S-box protein [Oscillospiraceae bacterium]|nr:PAS domain S-box protein [Oscillospiraceae bacterium]